DYAVLLNLWTIRRGLKAVFPPTNLACFEPSLLKGHHGTLADVILRDVTNANHTLVKNGWCWWYRKYAPGNTELESLEKEARDAKKGLWADPAPIPPWVYGKANSSSPKPFNERFR